MMAAKQAYWLMAQLKYTGSLFVGLLTSIMQIVAIQAATTGPVHAGQIDSGEAPHERCALCHGLFGSESHPKFPKLAGQPVDYLYAQLMGFLKAHRINDGGQMRSIVTELNRKELRMAAEWFASQDPPAPSIAEADAAAVKLAMSLGKTLLESADCGNCHGANASEVETDTFLATPYLEAQHKEYLFKQMTDMRDGRRYSDTDLSRKLLRTVDAHNFFNKQPDSALHSLAIYFSSLPRP